MRRSQFGLLTVVAAVGLLLAPGCQLIQPVGSLTVVSLNDGNTLRSDLSDFSFDPVESVYVYQVQPDSIKVEMKYAEIGAGLPTWTPPEAIVTQASIKFTSKNINGEEAPPYEVAKIVLREVIPSDPTGKKTTTFRMTPISASWKQKVFADFLNEDDPTSFDIVDIADAVVTFTGNDPVIDRQLSASGSFQIEFGNFYDDPNRFGR
jgi:hypothetical protein